MVVDEELVSIISSSLPQKKQRDSSTISTTKGTTKMAFEFRLEKKEVLLLILVLCLSLLLNAYFFTPFAAERRSPLSDATRTMINDEQNNINVTAIEQQGHFKEEEENKEDEMPPRTNTSVHEAVHSYGNNTTVQGISSTGDFQPFNETNPHKTSWCPTASCHNSPICAPCNKCFLFILATGRSGSTSLLNMMNKLPNVRLSGENNNELFVASKLEKNLLDTGLFHYEKPAKGAWAHSAVPNQAMACIMQKVMTTIDPPPAEVLSTLNKPNHPSLEEYEGALILGAKIIRIQQARWSPEDAVAYFQENFPCSRYIVNYSSNVEGQVNSRMNLKWGNNYEIQVKALVKENKFLKKFASLMGQDAAQLIDMNEWTEDVSVLNNVLDWMGYQKCHFRKVLHDNYHGQSTDPSELNIGEHCHYPDDHPTRRQHC